MQFFVHYLTELTIFALVDTVLICLVIPFILVTKRDPTVAVAWSLVVLFMPVVGAVLFWAFGYTYMHRRLKRKRTHRSMFRLVHPPSRHEARRGAGGEESPPLHPLAGLALAVNAFPVTENNRVQLYHETTDAYRAILDAIDAAQHHIHLQFFIFRSDSTGKEVVAHLTAKARSGVRVRLLYDAVGGIFLSWRMLRPLMEAGGQVCTFLPVNPLRSWIRVNLRNHRKIVVVDGKVGFTGGMNIGDEYLGKCRRFGYWRDEFLRIDGPAVSALQRVFMEDWHFAALESLPEEEYFPPLSGEGDSTVQVAESGPDQEINSIRELYFGAIISARRRLWIATPYFVPDSGMLDALRLARLRGVDVRLLCLLRPDHYLSFYASRYYWADMLSYGARVYQYSRGMMHSKILLVDDNWVMVGSANLDNRSLHLNFEIGCIFYSEPLIADIEQQFLRDLEESIPLDPETFAQRSLLVQLTENACRLFSPIL